MQLVQILLSESGSVVFACRVCSERCDAPPGVPLDQATRAFLAMHPACADSELHDDGCPDGQAVGAC